MLNSVIIKTVRRIDSIPIKILYSNIIKLEWLAVIGLLIWEFIIFVAILH